MTDTYFLGHWGAGESTEKSFSFDRAAEHSVVFDWYRLDSWDGETFRVWLNGQQVLQSPGFSGWGHARHDSAEDVSRLNVPRCTATVWNLIPAYCSANP